MGGNNLNPKLRLYETLSDMEVVERIISGDHPLFELIMRRYNQRLFRCSRSILADDGLAQDAMQEAYLHAYRHLNQFRGPDGFGAWLTRIATRTAIRMGRKESAIKLVGAATDPDELETDARHGPERLAINDEITTKAARAIDRLPRDFRVVFMLREVEGLSIGETAAILELNPTTVKTRLHRARHLLRRNFKLSAADLRTQRFGFAGCRCNAMVARVFVELRSNHFQ